MFFKYSMHNNPKLAEQLMFGSSDEKINEINERLWKRFGGNRFDYYLYIAKLCGRPITARARYVIAMAYCWNSSIYCKEAIKYLKLYLAKPLYKEMCVSNGIYSTKRRTELHLCEMYSNLGKEYRCAKDYKKAIESYTIALSYNPRTAPPYLRLAETYYFDNKLNEAINILEMAQKTDYIKHSDNTLPSEYIDIEVVEKVLKEYKQRLYIETTYPYKQKQVRELVMTELKKQNLDINLTQPKLKIICEQFNLKNRKDLFYKYPDSDIYRCSKKLVEILVNSLINNPSLINEIKMLNKK